MPIVFRGVTGLELNELQIWDFVDGQLPANIGRVVVLRGTSARTQIIQQKQLNRVHLHGSRAFVESQAHAGIVVKFDGLAQIPHQIVGALHREILVVSDRQFELRVVHVAHLQQLQGALNICSGTKTRRG